MSVRSVVGPLALSLMIVTGVAQSASQPARAHAAGAASAKVFASHKWGYTMSYPANWLDASNGKVDFLFASPDRNTFLSATSVSGHETASQVKQEQKTAFTSFGKVLRTRYSSVVVRGTTWQEATAEIKAKTGKTMLVILLDTNHGANFYPFLAIILDEKNPSASAELNQAGSALASITFTS